MIAIPDYQIVAKIYEGSNSIIYRARRQHDAFPVILKYLNKGYPTPKQLTRFKQEYTITLEFDAESIIQAYALQSYQKSAVMVLEDFGGESLNRILSKRSLPTETSLKLAIHVLEAIEIIHARHIIHKDLNPSNIVWNPETNIVKIIDFGISTQLSREYPARRGANVLEGTLAYISPEQTGRMNRAVDYRTDLYSFGITLYEMLCGSLPFESGDALEVVHCHLARHPVPVHERVPDVPMALSKIVQKLLSKHAEDRYQSAYGVKYDLQECLDALQGGRKMFGFHPGRHDVFDRFQISEKLYGRKQQVRTLLEIFQRVSEGAKELALVTGPAGVGKSSLVHELQKPIAAIQGYFISGKFDQLQRNIPYSGLIQALGDFVQQLLTENSQQLAAWKAKILKAVGSNGQVLIEAIPTLELVVGPQPPVPALGSEEALNRFHDVFQRFIQSICRPEHPVALFLDDLQWADAASLQLLTLLMADSATQALYAIGAYRNEEMSLSHPLSLALHEIMNPLNDPALASPAVTTIVVENLSFDDVNLLLADTLRIEQEVTRSLTQVIYKKTRGNAFFTKQFLLSLHEGELLTFAPELRRWSWDVAKIQNIAITNNVVELLIRKIEKLPPATQYMLKLGACVGNNFHATTLSVIAGQNISTILAQLWPAVTEELLLPPEENDSQERLLESENQIVTGQFRFSHDRIQQASYALIPETEKQPLHLKIGRLLLSNILEKEQEVRLFDLVNQFNQSGGRLTSRVERIQTAALNLKAGQKAKASAAYTSAFFYFSEGIALLAEEDWQTYYRLSLSLHEAGAEAASFCKNFEQMEEWSNIVLSCATTLQDTIRVYEIRIQAYIAQNKLRKAVDTGLYVLKMLDVRLPKKPTTIHFLSELIRVRLALGGMRIETLSELPTNSDPAKLSAMKILHLLGTVTYMGETRLYPLIGLKMLMLTLKYGNSPESYFGYSSYGIILCSVLKKFDAGYRFGLLSLKLLERFDRRELHTKILFLFNAFIRHWTNHAGETLPGLLEACHYGQEHGDLKYAAYSARFLCIHSLVTGKKLAEIEREIGMFTEIIQQLKQKQLVQSERLTRQVVFNLRSEKCQDPSRISGKFFREKPSLDVEKGFMFSLSCLKLFLGYLFQKYHQASEDAIEAEKYANSLGHILIPAFYFYDSLLKLALISDESRQNRKLLIKKIAANQHKMRKWASYAPMNFLHKYYLVEAERARVAGKPDLAMHSYTQAIALAKDHKYLHEEALANELAARFYRERNEPKVATVYLKEAHYCYLTWGAKNKVRHLEQSYPELFKKPYETEKVITLSDELSTDDALHAPPNLLDMKTVMKSAQAISSEIFLDKLLDMLLSIILENSGATTATLILRKDNELSVEAQVSAEDGPQLFSPLPLQACRNISPAVVQFVARTHETVLLPDPQREGRFSRDTYISRYPLHSILCSPLMLQGDLNGILFLENDLVPDAFPPQRLQIIELLCSQAAISIGHAHLYRELQSSEKKYRFLYDNAFEGIFQITPEGDLISANRSLAAILGFNTSDELIASGKLQKHCVNPMSLQRVLERLVKDGQVNGYEVQAVRKDSQVIWVVLWGRAIIDKNGQLKGYEGVLVDVTERKEKERVERERQAHEAASQAKSEFLANLSHEIRNPLQALVCLSELTLSASSVSQQQEYMELVKACGENLHNLLNGVLDLSRIEKGKFELEERNFDLHQVITATVNPLAFQARKNGVELVTSIEPEIPPRLRGDAKRLGQILGNLVGNAVKFTHQGTITVTVKQDILSVEQIFLIFSVRDTGVGIRKEDKSGVFNRFSRGCSVQVRKTEGVGLGTTIVKALLEQMGGNIWFESNPETGSHFQCRIPFWLPTSQCSDAAEDSYEPPPSKPLHILLVEDNLFNQHIVADSLRLYKHEVTIAGEGNTALSLWQASHYDVVLMDIHLPGMNGLQITERIRELENTHGGHTWIIALTAAGMQEDKERCLAAGMDDYLPKPVNISTLLAVLQKTPGRANQLDSPPFTEPEKPVTHEEKPHLTSLLCLEHLPSGVLHDRARLQEYTTLLIRDIQQGIACMEEALRQENANALAKAAHTTKGPLGHVNVSHLQDFAFQVEQMAKQQCLPEASEPLARLKREFAVLVNEYYET